MACRKLTRLFSLIGVSSTVSLVTLLRLLPTLAEVRRLELFFLSLLTSDSSVLFSSLSGVGAFCQDYTQGDPSFTYADNYAIL